MLTAAWIFMGIAISASIVLLGDLKREKEYNNRVRKRRTERKSKKLKNLLKRC